MKKKFKRFDCEKCGGEQTIKYTAIDRGKTIELKVNRIVTGKQIF